MHLQRHTGGRTVSNTCWDTVLLKRVVLNLWTQTPPTTPTFASSYFMKLFICNWCIASSPIKFFQDGWNKDLEDAIPLSGKLGFGFVGVWFFCVVVVLVIFVFPFNHPGLVLKVSSKLPTYQLEQCCALLPQCLESSKAFGASLPRLQSPLVTTSTENY